MSDIACDDITHIYGAEEWNCVVNCANRTQKINPNIHTIIASGAGHDMNYETYVQEITRCIKNNRRR